MTIRCVLKLLKFKLMDKRSFTFLFTFVAASMLIMGTYKIAKKKNHTAPQQSSKIVK